MVQCEIGGRSYELELGPLCFCWKIGRNLVDRPCLMLYWSRETQFKNLEWFRFVALHLGSPWLKVEHGVTDFESS